MQGPRHAPLMMAGLFDTWKPKKESGAAEVEGEGENVLETATILTMESDGTPIFAIHDRTPVFLTPETAAMWLDSSRTYKQVISPVLRAAQTHANTLLIYEVAPLVSNIRNESCDCILPKKDYDARKFSAGLGKFFSNKTPAIPGSEAPETKAPPPKRPPEAEVGGAPVAKMVRAAAPSEQDSKASLSSELRDVVIDLDD